MEPTESAVRRGRPSKFDVRHGEVISNAAAVFAEAGFGGATMHQLAARLGVTRPALYHYATGKDALFDECVQTAESSFNNAVVDALAETSGRRQVKTFFLAYCDICSSDFGRCFAFTDLRELDANVRDMLLYARSRLKRAVASMIRSGIVDGSICARDPDLVSALLFSAFNGVSQRWRFQSDEERRAVAQAILAVFFAGLEPRGRGQTWDECDSARQWPSCEDSDRSRVARR